MDDFSFFAFGIGIPRAWQITVGRPIDTGDVAARAIVERFRMLPAIFADSAMQYRAAFGSLFTNWLIYYRDVTHLRETCDMSRRPLPADVNFILMSAAESACKEFIGTPVRQPPGRHPNPL